MKRRLGWLLPFLLVPLLLLLLGPALPASGADRQLFTAEGYRQDALRSPTPASVPGGRVVDTAGVARLVEREKAALIDVLPAPIRPPDLAPGTLWMPEERRNIPGSLWLPAVGMPVLSDALTAYFADGLRRATGGNKAAPVIIYCRPDCWLSWNAAKRAAAMGYSRVYWYPDGVEGWVASGRPTQLSTPEPALPAP
jgi:PQQ-dependent catabolism-associated CXXCW motif protein